MKVGFRGKGARHALISTIKNPFDENLPHITENPHCQHGPAILLEKHYGDGKTKKFYACSAYRDRKFCPFYLEGDKKFCRKNNRNLEDESFMSHQKKYDRFIEQKNINSFLGFCNTCSDIITKKEVSSHSKCDEKVSLEIGTLPTQLLCPKSNPKCEAQYFFTKKSLQDLVKMLSALPVEKLLCVGVPRLHEACQNGLFKSVLMDIDNRFCHFFSPEEFVLYNMFNHHFFSGPKSKEVYLNFLKGSEEILLVIDPPFGGRMELIANTFHQIQDDWRKINRIASDRSLPFLFVFPYFLEKSVKTNLPGMSMLEYLVDYDNHVLYTTGPKGMKRGSPVRLFTNLPADQFSLPPEDGYTFCNDCKRWVHPQNAHCLVCLDCTSKDGSTYRHCDLCGFCVKPKWQHCIRCSRCLPTDHNCRKPRLRCEEDVYEGSTTKSCDDKGRATLKRKDEASSTKQKRVKRKLPQTFKEEKERDLDILKQMFDGI